MTKVINEMVTLWGGGGGVVFRFPNPKSKFFMRNSNSDGGGGEFSGP